MICDKNKIYVDTTYVLSTTHKFDTREEVIKWIKEIGIQHKVTLYRLGAIKAIFLGYKSA